MTSPALPPQLAFLGMGLMGSRMSLRLLNAGFSVDVWNRTVAACEPLLKAGAGLVHLDQLEKYDVIALCLSDDQAVEEVISQLLPFLKEGQVIVDFSSLSLEATKKLAAQVVKKGAEWLDAPVSGGVQGAEAGSLIIFAGGALDTVARLSSFFEPISQKVTYMGPVGSGQVTKICNQLIVAVSAQLISEAVNLAQQAGVDANQLAPALAGGFADSKPLQILAPRMATGTFEPVQWKGKTLHKDLSNAIKLANEASIKLPVAKFALERYAQHLEEGYGEMDLSALILQSYH